MEHQAVYLGVRRRLGICQKGEKAQEARLAEKHPFQELSILLERARLYPERAEAAGLKRAGDSDRIKEILPGGEGIDMAQAYPYPYRGELRMKQDKCRASAPLDKARIWLDFNELCAVDEKDGAPVYLFSQGDIVNDSQGADVELREGMEASVFDGDFDGDGRTDALLADGIVIRNFLEGHPQVKWLIKLAKHGEDSGSGAEYVYWMSDLR